ncbi:gamma-glutamylcyclotransferase-like [Ostrinia nubilalis]|uniref:gamma-glutamylcyclotransferase-like n=1 Tax=Ostrinia nubilalis TaxID=29057 RepID=UPI0030826AF4
MMFQTVNDTFYYFAYGSNLLKKRIHINNPSAEFVGIGRLNDHLLDFFKYSENWRGAVATIVPLDGAYVWGAVWKISDNSIPALDKQEGVDTSTYFPKMVTVFTPTESKVECRTYQLTDMPTRRLRDDNTELPSERRPSITYLDCIIKGAMECKLPDEYIEKLRKVPHNNQEATPQMQEILRG